MLDQAARAIEPRLPLAQASGEWGAISTALAESPRWRLAQLAGHLIEYPRTMLTLMGMVIRVRTARIRW